MSQPTNRTASSSPSSNDYIREWTPAATVAARLLDRAESYQRDAGVIRQSGLKDEAVVYETIAAELRQIAEEVGK